MVTRRSTPRPTMCAIWPIRFYVWPMIQSCDMSWGGRAAIESSVCWLGPIRSRIFWLLTHKLSTGGSFDTGRQPMSPQAESRTPRIIEDRSRSILRELCDH